MAANGLPLRETFEPDGDVGIILARRDAREQGGLIIGAFLSAIRAGDVVLGQGKDRAGFVAFLLEALMGAELSEIVDDYMLSFYNYYGIDKASEPERYQTILDNNLIAMLCHVAGVDTPEDLADVNLESAVTEYLLHAGMTKEDIVTLKEKLR